MGLGNFRDKTQILGTNGHALPSEWYKVELERMGTTE